MKSRIEIPVYSEQDLSPKSKDTIYGILGDRFPDHDVKLYPYQANIGVKQVLVFGNNGPKDHLRGVKFVYTYSIAQIMTKANAATVLEAGVRQFIYEQEKPPFEYVSSTTNIRNITLFDYDKPIAIDIETSGNLGETHTPEEVEILSVAFYQAGFPPLVYVSTNAEGVDERTHPLEYSQLEDLAAILPLFNKAIYHNGKFDTRVLNRVLGVKLTNWFDTMLAHHVLNQAAGDHKLKHLARQYLGAPDWEGGIKNFLSKGAHYEFIPLDMIVKYNGWDVYWTYKLYELFAPQIEADEDAAKAFMLEMAAADFLLEVEQYGIPFDVAYATKLGDELTNAAVVHKRTLTYITGDDKFNPGSWQQVKAWLSSRGVETASTDEEHITEIMDRFPSGHIVEQFCVCLLNYRRAVKMQGTYVKGWSKHERNGRVHPTFLVHGTSTGRLSSTGPNAQNVPRDKKIRRLVSL